MKKTVFHCSHFCEKIQQIQKAIGFKRWLEQNTQIDESFSFCVLKEWVTKCYICEQKNIPIYFKEIPEDCITIFDIPQSGVKHKWNILMKEDIKRNIQIGNKEECFNFIKAHKKAFVKSFNKLDPLHFTPHYIFDITSPKDKLKNILSQANNDYDVRLIEDIQNWKSEGKSNEDCVILSKLQKIPYTPKNPLLFCKVYDVKKERRFILKENEIISYSQTGLDYKRYRDNTTERDITAMIEFVQYLANKYYKQVPYKIWNIDIAFFNGMLDIVECHFHCQQLGHYLDNIKHFGKYFD